SVGGWLHEAAYRLALRARADAARRQAREREAAERSRRTPAAVAVRELAVMLDEELQRLPRPYRAPLLLCCLEGRPTDEAARQLGLPLRTLQRRLRQGRELLRRRLARQGFTLSAALLGATLGQAASTVPAALVSATVKAALLTPAGSHTLAAAGALVLTLALLGAGAGVLVAQRPGEEKAAAVGPKAD